MIRNSIIYSVHIERLNGASDCVICQTENFELALQTFRKAKKEFPKKCFSNICESDFSHLERCLFEALAFDDSCDIISHNLIYATNPRWTEK